MPSVQGIKNSPESAKYLAMAMEMYFTLVDDQDADVRMVADENLNRVTRSLGDSSVGRLQGKYKLDYAQNGAKLRFKGGRFKNMNWTTYIMNL